MSEATRLEFRDYWRLVRHNHNYRRLWFAQIVSEMGDWLYSVVIYSQLLEKTGSAKALGGAVVLQVLPQVLASPVAGVLNDRLPRRTVMITADILRFFIVLGMMYAVATNATWLIYVMLFCESVLWGMFEPGRDALLPNLTSSERERLAANTLSATTWSFNLAAGTALGGFLAAAFGVNTVFVINAASFLVSAAFLLRLRIRETHAEHEPPLRPRDLLNFRPVLEGFRYIASQRRLFATLFAKAGLGVMGANHIILPVLGDREFRIGSGAVLGMSVLMTARGVGALIGPAVSGYWAGGRPDRLRRGILYGFFGICAGYLIVWQAPTLILAIAGVVLAHGSGSTIWVFSTTMLQSQAEDRFRGRVFSADYAFLIVSMSLSTWTGGVAVDAGAAPRTVALAVSLLVLIPAAAWALWAMPLWRDPDHARESLRA
ncbi:MAG: MFS transporter [Acidobacteria bacterium]|nr:MFS transporter [Acidobacteriota bacterium]